MLLSPNIVVKFVNIISKMLLSLSMLKETRELAFVSQLLRLLGFGLALDFLELA